MSPIEANRTYLFVAVIAALIFIPGLIISCSSSNILPQQNDRPTIEAKGIEIQRRDENDNVIMRFVSSSAEYHERNENATAYEVEAWFFNSDGDETLHLIADEVDYNFRTGDLHVRGNLSGEGMSDARFETDEAYWNEEDRVLTGEAAIRAERDNMKIEGSSFRYDAEDGKLYVDKPRLEVILESEN